jgi:hypothetical protein
VARVLLGVGTPPVSHDQINNQGPDPADQPQGVRSTSLAAARKRLPLDVDYPIERDLEARRYRIEPVAAELLLAAVDRARIATPLTGDDASS